MSTLAALALLACGGKSGSSAPTTTGNATGTATASMTTNTTTGMQTSTMPTSMATAVGTDTDTGTHTALCTGVHTSTFTHSAYHTTSSYTTSPATYSEVITNYEFVVQTCTTTTTLTNLGIEGEPADGRPYVECVPFPSPIEPGDGAELYLAGTGMLEQADVAATVTVGEVCDAAELGVCARPNPGGRQRIKLLGDAGMAWELSVGSPSLPLDLVVIGEKLALHLYAGGGTCQSIRLERGTIPILLAYSCDRPSQPSSGPPTPEGGVPERVDVDFLRVDAAGTVCATYGDAACLFREHLAQVTYNDANAMVRAGQVVPLGDLDFALIDYHDAVDTGGCTLPSPTRFVATVRRGP